MKGKTTFALLSRSISNGYGGSFEQVPVTRVEGRKRDREGILGYGGRVDEWVDEWVV